MGFVYVEIMKKKITFLFIGAFDNDKRRIVSLKNLLGFLAETNVSCIVFSYLATHHSSQACGIKLLTSQTSYYIMSLFSVKIVLGLLTNIPMCSESPIHFLLHIKTPGFSSTPTFTYFPTSTSTHTSSFTPDPLSAGPNLSCHAAPECHTNLTTD